jgi:hypothetical protein
MKKTYLLSALAGLILAGCTPMMEEHGLLEGVWDMQHQTFSTPDTTVMWMKGDMNQQVKMFTKGYFSFVNMSPSEDMSGLETHGGSGTYTVTGDTLTEVMQLVWNKAIMGARLQYKVTVSGDTLTQEGPINADVPESWKGFHLKEIYLRLE